MDSIKYDTWIDELDWHLLNEKGIAVLRRKYIKGKEYIEPYMSHPEKAPIVAKGIVAFLFSNTYSGGIQLIPLTSDGNRKEIDIKQYYQQYFLIRKKFIFKTEKSNPDSIHKNLERTFLSNHIKQEKSYYRSYKKYFETIKSKEESLLREKYALSYLKWIDNKRKPLKVKNYFELLFWITLCLTIVSIIVLEFFWVDSNWNIVQSINKEFIHRDELSQQILIFLFIAFISSFSFGYLRIKKIFKTHRI